MKITNNERSKLRKLVDANNTKRIDAPSFKSFVATLNTADGDDDSSSEQIKAATLPIDVPKLPDG